MKTRSKKQLFKDEIKAVLENRGVLEEKREQAIFKGIEAVMIVKGKIVNGNSVWTEDDLKNAKKTLKRIMR